MELDYAIGGIGLKIEIWKLKFCYAQRAFERILEGLIWVIEVKCVWKIIPRIISHLSMDYVILNSKLLEICWNFSVSSKFCYLTWFL